MTNNTFNKTPPSGAGGLHFYLNRYMQNRTFTHGKLQIQGINDVFDTLEMAIPRDKYSYVKHCLPPGEYKIIPELALITLKSGAVRKPWPVLSKVKWFPKAGLFTNFDDIRLFSGRIFIGLGSDDEWSVNQNDIVTARIVAALQTIYDEETCSFTEPVTLIITEHPDLIFHDYDIHQHEADLLAEQERKEREEAEQYFEQLSPLPTSPGGGE